MNLKNKAEQGFWEFYNPYSGEGMRIPNFGWTTLASVFDKYT